MKIYRDLFIDLRNSGIGIQNLIEKLELVATGGWKREKDREKESVPLVGEPTFCFIHKAVGGLPSALLFLMKKEEGVVYVPNIIPTEKSELSFDEYNELLKNFHDNILLKIDALPNLKIELTKSEINIEDVLPEKTAQLFRSFSSLANKSTGSSHPMDQKRWFAFLIDIHRKNINLSTDILEKALIEEGWSSDRAIKLVIEYEFGIEILRFNDEH